MSRLLRANFTRLWKNRIFWCCIIVMAGLALFAIYASSSNKLFNIAQSYFSCNMLIIIVEAVFMGIFIGTEYSDGVIRNKFVVGHSRAGIYFSNFFTCLTAELILYFVWIAVIFLSGGYQLFKQETKHILMLLFVSIAAAAAQAAIYLFIGMLIHKRAIGVVVMMVAALASIQIAEEIRNRLEEPKYYTGNFIQIDDDGAVQEAYSKGEKNPRYLTGTKRKIYETAERVLPSCQLYLINNWQITVKSEKDPMEHAEFFPLYSICVLIAVSGGGIFLFSRKDLK